MPSIRLAAAAAATCAALALVACGGDDTDEKNEYVDAVNEVTSTLNSGLTEIASSGTAVDGSPGEAAKVFGDFSKQLDGAAADLEAIDPPSDVTSQHDKLVGILDQLGAESQNAADEISQGGAAAVSGVATQFIGEANQLGSEADATIDDINSKLQE
jgi:ABC-type transporter Mla subunit MlaD